MKYRILYTLLVLLVVSAKLLAQQPTPIISGANPSCGNATGTLSINCPTCTIVGWEDGTLVDGTNQVFTAAHQYYGSPTTGNINVFTYNIQAPGKNAFRAIFSNSDGTLSYSRAVEIVADATPVAGTLSTSTTIFQNSASGHFTLAGSSGTVHWMKSTITNGSATEVTLTNGNFTETQTSDYYVQATNGACGLNNSSFKSNSIRISVYKPGTLTGPVSVTEGEKVTLSISADRYNNIMRWEYSIDGGATWTNFDYSSYGFTFTNDKFSDTHQISSDTKFRALVDLGPYGSGYTNTINVAFVPYTQTNSNAINGGNYVREQTVTVGGITDATLVDNLPSTQKHEIFSYMDGKGRSVQTNVKKGSPLQFDIVSPVAYDRKGRQQVQYLPFVSSLSDGAYKTNAIADQASFYGNGTTDKVADDPNPFASTVFEKSPVGRVTEQGNVGQLWQPGGNHSNVITYSNNDANDVRLFQSSGSSSGFYAVNDLSKIQSTDADKKNVLKFVDKEGRLILTRVQLDEVIKNAMVPWLETYYIYNESGSLKYMISPNGVDALKNASWALSPSILEQYTYQYVYDSRGRVVEKKVPGKAWVYYCYDRLDRIVLTQDANTRTANKWVFIKYDRRGRPVMQGLYVNATYTTRSALQSNVIDPLYALDTDVYYEERGTTLHGYSNVSFPTTGIEVQNINYYDSYDFDYNGTDDYSYTPQGLTNENSPTAFVFGMPTGSKQLVLNGGTTWLYNYVFYDADGRVIQSRSNNHLSTLTDNLTTVVYDFEGKTLTSKTYHNAGAGKVTTVINKMLYDHMGRITHVYQNNNGAATDQLVAKYEYNELGQLIDKKLHSTDGTNFLQSVDFRYNIQGKLTSINNAQLSNDAIINDDANDYFGMEFLYEKTETGLTAASEVYYNGNVSAIKWKGAAAPGATEQRSYKFVYDKSDKLKTATSQVYTGSAWTKEAGVLNENVTYDHNGNIQSLLRNQRKYSGLVNLQPVYTNETIDNLTYTYNAAMGDQLVQVTDAAAASSAAAGFDNGTTGNNIDYVYDVDGNLTKDLNKKINAIVYNHFGKPVTITFTDGHHVDYIYSAAGAKLSMKKYNTSNVLENTTDYVGAFIYENNVLSFFGSPEGRVVNNSGTLEYQYAIADHQGNTRVVFSSATTVPNAPQATFESDANDGGGQYLNIVGGNVVSFGNANHTTGGSKVVRMNQTYKVGPARSIKVYPGDKVDIEVWEYHEGTAGFGTSSTPLTTLITSVAGAFGGVSGGVGESGTIYNGVSTALNNFPAGGNQGDGRPAAYLNYILFDKDYNVLDAGWQLAPAANFTKQKLSFNTISIKEAGYVYAYLSYDNNSSNWVYFDDFKVTHIRTNIIQYNEYYPFGLQANTSWTRDNSKNNFLHNQGSELNTSTGWYDLPFRNYDPAIGHFTSIDPMAEKYASYSGYHYSFNNPIMFNDPSGADSNNPTTGTGYAHADFVGNDPAAFLDEAMRSDFGGHWEQAGSYMFKTAEQAYNAGAAYNNYFNSWGDTFAGSESQAHANFSGLMSFSNQSSAARIRSKWDVRFRTDRNGNNRSIRSVRKGVAQQGDVRSNTFHFFPAGKEKYALEYMMIAQELYGKEVSAYLVDGKKGCGVLILPWAGNTKTSSNRWIGYNHKTKTITDFNRNDQYTVLLNIHTHPDDGMGSLWRPSEDDITNTRNQGIPGVVMAPDRYILINPTLSPEGHIINAPGNGGTTSDLFKGYDTLFRFVK